VNRTKPTTNFCMYGTVLAPLAAGIIAIGFASAAWAADSKYSMRDNRLGASDSQNSRDSSPQPSRGRASAQPMPVPSVQQSAPVGRVVRQETTRSAPVVTPFNSMRQPSSFGWDRSKSVDTRIMLVDGNDRQGNDRRGLDRGPSNKSGSDKSGTDRAGDSSPPVRRSIQRDTPPSSSQNSGSSDVRRQIPPSSQNIGDQIKSSDVRKRLEGKSGVSGSDALQLERRSGTERTMDKSIAPRDSGSSS
jgi:hypothetical protein